MKTKCIVQSFYRPVISFYDLTLNSGNFNYFITFRFTDENFIVCSGLSETMHIFEIQKRMVSEIGTFDSKKKKRSPNNEVQWGTLQQNDTSKLRSQEKRKLRKLEKKAAENADEIADSLNAVKLNSTDSVKVVASFMKFPNQFRVKNSNGVFFYILQLNYSTILYLTSKELNKEPLDQLQRLLNGSSTVKNGKNDTEEENVQECLHSKLFGDRENVTQLLDQERKWSDFVQFYVADSFFLFCLFIHLTFYFSEKS